MRYLLLLLALSGCAISPIPSDIELRHNLAHQLYPEIQSVIQSGDIIFRLGDATILNGIVDFSHEVAKMSHSDFSHAVLVLRGGAEPIIVDVSEFGLERQFLIDWLIKGSQNIVVKRLQDPYRYLVPQIINTAYEWVEKDPLYDASFKNSQRFYCTEFVYQVFYSNGIALGEPIPIQDLPGFYKVFIWAKMGELLGKLDLKTPVIVAGNDEIGLFSSDKLRTVLDLRLETR